MRMFIGIKLSDENLKKIHSLQQNLKVNGNFTKINNIHLTLLFLGELEKNEIEKVIQILDSIKFSSFSFDTISVQMLRDIVILKIKNNSCLQKLRDELFNYLFSAGFKLDNRKYFPHITLVRKSDKRVNFNFQIREIVKEVILFSSERENRNLCYVPRYTMKLN